MTRRHNPHLRRPKFRINDHEDILVEVLTRLDGRSLSVAACVCRLWSAICRDDQLWESLCFRHVAPAPSGVRPVVAALGGYKRLYMACLRPVMTRYGMKRVGSGRMGRVRTRDELQLSLSLFCVDCYERLGGASSSSSLMFLCKPVIG